MLTTRYNVTANFTAPVDWMKILLSPKETSFWFLQWSLFLYQQGLPLSNDRILASPNTFILACILFSPYGYNIPLLSLTYGYNADILTICFQILVSMSISNFSRCARRNLRCPVFFFPFCCALLLQSFTSVHGDSEFIAFHSIFSFLFSQRNSHWVKFNFSSPVVYNLQGISVPSFILGCVQW